ncbi:MAG: ABC transporter permease subunit [Anaerolineales bacterium]
MNRLYQIVRKEWAEVFKNRFVLVTVAFLPLMAAILPLGILYFVGSSSDIASDLEEIPSSFMALCNNLTGEECMQYFLISQFILLFMIIPLAIPITIASYSIIGEKTTRTLEPLLATPITTAELLGGKSAAAVMPGVAATWFAYVVLVIGVTLMGVGPGVMDNLLNPFWLIAVFIVGPLLALTGVSVAVMVSSRATDPRTAEQTSMLVFLPVLLIFFAQMAGLIFIDAQLVIVFALALVAIDAALLTAAVRLFQRETILTRWK